MATTYLQIVNSVLRRLREREVTTVKANSYSKLIGEFVNDAIKEVESRWDWMGLRNSVIVTTVADSFRYAFTGVGPEAKLIHDTYGRPSVYNDSEDYFLRKAPSSRWMSERLNANSPSTDKPIYFDFVGVDDGELLVDLWPTPDAEYTITFDMIVPHGTIDDDATILKIPAQPVILCAWSKAIYERGEDQGYLSDLPYRQYEKALGDAISIDMMNNSDDLIWRPE